MWYSTALTLDAVFGGNVASSKNGLCIGIEPNGNIGTCFSKRLRYGQADTASGSGDDCRLALEGEEGHDPAVWCRRERVVAAKDAVTHAFRHDEGLMR